MSFSSSSRPRISGKFFRQDDAAFYVKGVTYGTFAPGPDGVQFPDPERVAGDFALMSARGINTVRLYTPPRPEMLDAAERWGLKLMIGLPWTQHVAFLDDPKLCRQIRRDVQESVRSLAGHPASLLFALGNEIPPAVVRWHGKQRVERFLRELLADAREAAPESYFTYVNFPTTEFLDVPEFDVCAFNLYLHDDAKLRSYLTRLQHLAGHKPLLLAEAGACSRHEGDEAQAEITAKHIKIAFEEGLCGAFAFAWTDEWWRGGHDVEDWAFGLVDKQRRPKKALAAVTQAFEQAPFPAAERAAWPKVSVVVCAYNASDTLEDCLSSLEKLNYPNYEVILVNDGSKDATPQIARQHPSVQTIDVYPNGGLSAARNTGMYAASGEIVAYTDADVRVDPEWLTYLVQPFLRSDVVGSGGPNVVPVDDPWIAQCVARAPGGPTQVLLDDRTAEHVPGCNMAFRRDALVAIGGFNPVFLRAGDDVDVCWRLQAKGGKIGFSPSALVWHHHRATVKAYWRQQMGYGEGELWLVPHHPDKFAGGHMLWHGRIYSPLPFVRSLTRPRINAGLWGMAPFPSVYHTGAPAQSYLPHSIGWQAAAALMMLTGLVGLASPWTTAAVVTLLSGLGLVAVTALKCLRYAFATDIDSLATLEGLTPRASRTRYRRMIAWLHFIQPLARLRGRIRGLFNPPEEPAPDPVEELSHSLPGLSQLGLALMLLAGRTVSRRYWSETWTSAETVLGRMLKELRGSRVARVLSVDDGWHQDRDISVKLGPWARLDLRALVEEHAEGRVLLRLATRLRLTGLGAVTLALVAAVVAALGAAQIRIVPLAGVVLALGAVKAILSLRLIQATAAVQRAMARTAAAQGMISLDERAPVRVRPRRLAWGMRGAVATALVGVASLSGSSTVPQPTRGVDATPAAATAAPRTAARHASIVVSSKAGKEQARKPKAEKSKVDFSL